VTPDSRLAQELRRMVHAFCREHPSRGRVIRRTLNLGARVVAHWEPLYGLARTIQGARRHPAPPDGIQPTPGNWLSDGTQSEEWRRLPVRPELRMAAYNFQNWAKDAVFRRELETHYRRFLHGLAEVTLPAPSQGVLSHFTIRVAASERDRIRQRLWKHGIDTGDIFGFPRYCDPAMFPHAFTASRELINLPMDRGVTVAHVRCMAGVLGMNSGEQA